jgi:two-component system sensor histidine kinase FlrB
LQPVIGPAQAVTIARPATPITLHGNREALAGAVLNLATNALQAAGEKARVDIATRLTDDQLEILVSDNGPGVAPGIRAQIFDPFFTSRADGTGLGLAVARSVARAHQGDVALLDDDTRGATFVIRLPAAGANTAAQTHRNAAA